MAFVRTYIQRVNEAYESGDSDLIKAYADPGCKTCAGFVADVNSLHAAGLRMDGPVVELKTALAEDGGDTNQQRVSVSGRQVGARKVDAAGTVQGQDSVQDFTQTFLCAWREGRWLVMGAA